MKNFFVGVKAAIVNESGELLILKTPKGYWELPGGRIDDNETLEETLIRELNEELLNVKEIKIKNVVHSVRMPFDIKDNLGLVLIVFLVNAKFDGEVEISDEHIEYKWASLEEAEELVDMNGKETIKRLTNLSL